MRKILCAVFVIAICAGVMAACATAEPISEEQGTGSTEAPTQLATPEVPTEAPEEPKVQQEEDNRTEEILAFLSVLGLGEETVYENVDWFDQDMLISVPSVDAVQFDAINQKLKDDGYVHPQDPEYIEETTMRHNQYSGGSLFIDMSYIEKDEYLTALFSPLE